jgi:hypothetical protein
MHEPPNHVALGAIEEFSSFGPIAIRVRAGCHQQRIPDGYDRRSGGCVSQRGEGVDEVWISDGVDVGADRSLVRDAVLVRVQTLQKLVGNVDVIATDRDRDERVVAVG